jgi:hypothetical protein
LTGLLRGKKLAPPVSGVGVTRDAGGAEDFRCYSNPG